MRNNMCRRTEREAAQSGHAPEVRGRDDADIVLVVLMLVLAKLPSWS